MRKLALAAASLVVAGLLFDLSNAAAQVDSGLHSKPRVIQPIDETTRAFLRGNVRPEANSRNDRGAVPATFPLEHMLLQLKRSPEQEKAVQQFVGELHTQGSPNFHRWVSAQEFGERFGFAQPDLEAVVAWRKSHGFQVNVVYPSGMLIHFSGTAGRCAMHSRPR